jgi:flagellar biosynthetic protein FliR
MTFAPFFNSHGIPMPVKAGLTLALTMLAAPLYVGQAPQIADGRWAMVILQEAALGLGMGLAVQFVFEGAQLAGNILGFQLGYSLVNIIDPQSQVDTPVLSVFHGTAATLLFLNLNVHFWLLRGIMHSFSAVPPGSVFVSASAVSGLFGAAESIWQIALQIAGPALAVTLLVDITVGFLSRATPQLPALTIGLSLKALAGYAVIGLSMTFWPALFDEYFMNALRTSERLLHAMH